MQAISGNSLAHIRNIAGQVDNVEYYGGATLVNRNRLGEDSWGLTLGSYINSQNIEVGDNMFIHEYGHTLQSRVMGPLYITHIGIPSLLGSGLDKLGLHNHHDEWYEVQANVMSYRYLRKQDKVLLDKSGWDIAPSTYEREYVMDWYLFMFPPTALWLFK